MRLLVIALLFAASNAFAGTYPLTNYQQILHALKNGMNVRGIVTLDNCKLTEARTSDGHEEFKGDFIGMDFQKFSNTHYTIDGKSKNGVVTSQTEIAKHEHYNYRTQVMKVFEDNTAEYTWAIGSAKSGDILKTWTWTCQIGNNRNDNAGSVFFVNH